MENSNISWTKHTGNLWWGCEEKPFRKGEPHPGCVNCFARDLDKRYKGEHWGHARPRRFIQGTLSNFMKWERAAAEAGEVHRVFVGSMMDIFERSRPLVDLHGNPVEFAETGALRDYYFREIVPQTPHLMHLLLTKRPENILKMIPAAWRQVSPENVMYGYSAVDQDTANFGIPYLLQVPGRHFLSLEPLLGAMDVSDYLFVKPVAGKLIQPTRGSIGAIPLPELRFRPRVNWVIVGGESGSHARMLNLAHAYALLRQCREAGVPFFMKQDSARLPGQRGRIADDLWVQELP